MNTAPDKQRPERLSWGPGAWVFLQACVFAYPEEPGLADKWLYKRFLLNSMRILPCGLCRDSTALYLAKHPLGAYLHSRQALAVWIYKIHNLVNCKLGKKSCRFVDFVQRYEAMRARCNPSKTGCTEPFVDTLGPAEPKPDFASWADDALQKYWDFEHGEQRWKESQCLIAFVTILVAAVLLYALIRFIRRYRLVPRRVYLQHHY